MKIDRIGIKNIDTINNPKNNIKNNNELSFREVIDKKTGEFNLERTQIQLLDITESGKKLASKRTIENLFDYKKKVKNFLDETLKSGLDLNKRDGFRRGGSSRLLKMVSKVDDKLIDLTDELINGENSRLNLLRLVGEIEGLLLNIYV